MKKHRKALQRWISFGLSAAMLCSPLTALADGGSPLPEALAVKELATARVSYGSSLEDALAVLPQTVDVVVEHNEPDLPSEILFQDDFANAATSEANWSSEYDPQNVVSFTDGKVSFGKSTNLKLVTGDEEWTDFVVEADISGESAEPTNNFGIMFRCTGITPEKADSYNGYYAGIGYSTTTKGNALVVGYANGSWNHITSLPITYQAKQKYNLKVVAYQDIITVFLDGVKLYQFQDRLFQNGVAGLRSYNEPFEATSFQVRTVTKADRDECGIVEEKIVSAQVAEWTCDGYDGKTPGSYSCTGTLAASKEFSNPRGLKAVCSVTVKDLPPLIDSDTAHALDFTQVNIDDAFWGARQKQFICQVIPAGISNVEKGGGGIPNIKNAALKHRGEAYGGFSGAFYVDSDVHKVLESMCYALQIDPKGDQEIMKGQQYIRDKLEEWIPYYVDAQEEDGYFDTYFTLTTNPKWTDFNLHELYCAGHFYEAAVAHYRATGDTRLLDVAVKNADYVDSLFGPGKWKQVPGHQEIELALIKLANLCTEIGELNGVNYGEKADKYIALSKFFLDTRGDYEGRHGTNHNSAQVQDHKPVAEQTEAVGHAVRAQYMYTGMADVALLEGTDVYDTALLSLWEDVTHRKQYVTGGVGSNPPAYPEGFDDKPYVLPNDTAYCETCANIANTMWNQRMNLLYGDSKYADIMERDLYNSIISCVNFDGDRFFYGNPMASNGGKQRSAWFGTACCPPNLMRTVEALGSYVYTQKGDEITLNLYVGSETDLNVGGNLVKLNLDTEMPWYGKSTMTVKVGEPQAFSIRFRVPDWATGENTVLVNGGAVSAVPDAAGYVVIDRTWEDGDTVELDFPMEVKRLHSDERVVTNLGKTAIQRGPIIYAAEAADNDFNFHSATLPPESEFTTEWVENLDGEEDPYRIKSVMKLHAPGKYFDEEITWTLIPYYSWCNRGAGSMAVYFNEEGVEDRPLEQMATPSASYTNPSETVLSLNDGTDARWTTWTQPTPNPWVQYDFDMNVTLWGCNVKWYDDGGGVQIPDGLTIEYWNGSEFVPVDQIGAYDTFKKNTENEYLFKPVITSKIRMNIKNDVKNVASGIMEWKLLGSLKEIDYTDIGLSAVRYGDRAYAGEYNTLNVATFAPATSNRFRALMDCGKPVGMKEFRLRTADGSYIEQQGVPTASYTLPNSNLGAVNDGKGMDQSSASLDAETWSTYPQSGEQWVEYTFEQPYTVDQAEICWYRAWDDGVVSPNAWKIQYFADGEWKDAEQSISELAGFDSKTYEYEVALPKGAPVPAVAADYDKGLAKIAVEQADALPGTAVITVTSAFDDAISRTYTIRFTEREDNLPGLLSVGSVPDITVAHGSSLEDAAALLPKRWMQRSKTACQKRPRHCLRTTLPTLRRARPSGPLTTRRARSASPTARFPSARAPTSSWSQATRAGAITWWRPPSPAPPTRPTTSASCSAAPASPGIRPTRIRATTRASA